MRQLSVALLSVVLAGSLVVAGASVGQQLATQQEESTDQATSYVRAIHASPDAPAVDVYVDDEQALSNVSFGTVSDYLAVAPGNHNVTITVAGDAEAVVFDGMVTLDARSATTIAATGEVSTEGNVTNPFEPVVYSDDALAPGEDSAALRVVHASPDAPTVDVTVTVDDETIVLADNVSFQDASDYLTVPAGDYTVDIRAATEANDGDVVTSVDVSLEGGTVYTAMASGYLNTTAAPADTPFQVLLTEDAQSTIALPGEETNATATPEGMETEAPGETETETPGETETDTEM